MPCERPLLPSSSRCTAPPGTPVTLQAIVFRTVSRRWSTSTPLPGKGASDPDFDGAELPLPPLDELRKNENVDGLTEAQLETFRQRAVPVPGRVLRESVDLTNDARRDLPSTLICTGYSAEEYQTYAREHPDWSFLAGVPELRNATWVDLPTSHWPMWSRPGELADIIGNIATAHARGS